MLTLHDVDRAAVPFPDTITIEYPDAEWFERDLREADQAVRGRRPLRPATTKTKAILDKLDEADLDVVPNETPLEDVLKYIKGQTATGPS